MGVQGFTEGHNPVLDVDEALSLEVLGGSPEQRRVGCIGQDLEIDLPGGGQVTDDPTSGLSHGASEAALGP